MEPFRSSPFFWTFASVMGEELSGRIFAFTAGLPVAGARGPFGSITHEFALSSESTGRLVSSVEMRLFDPLLGLLPGPSGKVVSEARVSLEGAVLKSTVESTRVVDSNVGPVGMLDAVVVPLDQAMSALRGEALQATARVSFCSDQLYVLRIGSREDGLLIYTR